MSDWEPGLKLDRLLAERALGYKVFDERYGGQHVLGELRLNPTESTYMAYLSELWGGARPWSPSRSIGTAFEYIVEKLRKDGWLVSIHAVDCKGAWVCGLSRPDGLVRMEGETAAHAICLAAAVVYAPDIFGMPVRGKIGKEPPATEAGQ